jgi:hypothetical protein
MNWLSMHWPLLIAPVLIVGSLAFTLIREAVLNHRARERGEYWR